MTPIEARLKRSVDLQTTSHLLTRQALLTINYSEFISGSRNAALEVNWKQAIQLLGSADV
jgi:hypothetical protein